MRNFIVKIILMKNKIALMKQIMIIRLNKRKINSKSINLFMLLILKIKDNILEIDKNPEMIDIIEAIKLTKKNKMSNLQKKQQIN